MYCPVDGDEFVEGVTRCPEHDVHLVEEPPELDEEVGDFVDYFSEAKSLRTHAAQSWSCRRSSMQWPAS